MRLSLSSRGRRLACTLFTAGLAAGGCSAHRTSFDPPTRAITEATDADSGRASAAAASTTSPFLTAYASSAPPTGFARVCSQYDWACSSKPGTAAEHEALQIATTINRQVNRKIRSVPDRELYGVAELWTLPTRGAGDCEDYALLKKKLLVEAGVPGNMLLLATALNWRAEPHAVLVLRLASGDLILDNETSAVKPWQETGHTYLKVQNAGNPSQWSTVLLGPLASRT